MALISLNLEQPESRNILNDPSLSITAGLNAMLAWGMNSEPTASGEIVDEATAEKFWAVYTCLRIIAEDVAGLPLLVYKQTPTTKGFGRVKVPDNPLYKLLSFRPNPSMSAVVFWESIVYAMALTGNGYALIGRNKANQPIELVPIHPYMIRRVNLSDGSMGYEVNQANVKKIFAAADILHFPLNSMNGLSGNSPINHNRNTIGLAKAIEKYAERFFGNASAPLSGTLSVDAGHKVKQEDLTNLRNSWEQAQAGGNRGRIAIIPQGFTFTPSNPPADNNSAQLLEARQNIRTEIAAMFRLPPHKLGSFEKIGAGNLEQQNLSYIRDSLKPYTTKIEQECMYKLLSPSSTLSFEFDFTELQRGDSKSMMDVFTTGRQWGIYTANECREMLGLNPVGPEGDVLWTPVNMQNSTLSLTTESIQDQPIGASQDDKANVAPTRSLSSPTQALTPLLRDAVGRLQARSKIEKDTFTEIFTPVVKSLTEIINTETRNEFDLDVEWVPSSSVNEVIKALEKRSQAWTGSADEITESELKKITRTLYINSNRDAAGFKAAQRYSEAA